MKIEYGTDTGRMTLPPDVLAGLSTYRTPIV